MTPLSPKKYQNALLASVEKYFRACRELGEAKKAFAITMIDLWGNAGSYRSLAGFAFALCLDSKIGGGGMGSRPSR